MARRKLDINSLPSNNQEEPEQLSAVTTGRITTRKKGGLANEIRNIGNSLFSSIVLPAMKGAVLDFFSDGLRMALFRGDNAGPRGGAPVAYNQQYQTRRRQIRRVGHNQPAVQNVQHVEELFDDIYFGDRREAQLVLGRMMERIANYGSATIGDLYSLVGLSPGGYTHEDYGWTDLRQCRILSTAHGYVIDFPEPGYLSR